MTPAALLAATWPLLCVALAVGGAGPEWRGAAGRLRDAVGQAGPWTWGPFLRAAAGHGTALVVVLLTLAAAAVCGRPAARWLGLGGGQHARGLVAAGSGFALVAMVQHGLGLAGLFAAPVLAVEVALLLAAGAVRLARAQTWRRQPVLPAGTRAPAAALAACLLAALAVARLPDTHEDARVYHLAAPEAYLQVHRIHAQPASASWSMPLGAEMLFALGWLPGDIEGAKLVNAAAALLAVAAAGALAAAAAGAAAGWWAAAWTAAAGLMANECWQAKDDLVLLLYTALAGWCAVEAVRGRRRWWLGAAWFLGHAAGVKFTAGFAAGGLVAAALAARARPPALALPLFAAGISGWLAESWLFFGNPVHPFLSGVFPDTAWNPAYARAATRAMDAISPASIRTAADWLAGGWRAWGDPLMGSPALLALAPAGLLLLRGGAALFLRWWLLAAYALWVPTDRIARYLFPLVPALAAFAGAAAAAAPARARAVLAVAMLFALAGAGEFALPQGWRYLAGQVSREEYLAQRFTTWEDARRWLNGRTTPHDGLLLTGEDRRLWFRARVPATLFVAEPIPWRLSRDSRTPEEMRKRFRQRGLTWWLHNFVQAEFRSLSWAPGPEWDDRQLAVYAGFARRYLEPVRSPPRIDYDNGGFQVYRIARRPSPRDYPLWFLPTTEGTFHEAHRLFADLRFLEARMEADRQAARLPPAGEVQLLHAKVLSAAGDVAGVVRILEPLNRSGFIGDANFKLLAAAAAQQDRIELALDQYARQWQVARDDGLLPPVGWCLYKLGQVHAARGEAARAARDFEQAERCAPAAAAIPYELARALRDTGRIPAARRAIARALALAPADPTIRSLAGELEPR